MEMGNEEIIKLVQKGIKKIEPMLSHSFPRLGCNSFSFSPNCRSIFDSHFIMMVIRSLIKITQMSDFLIWKYVTGNYTIQFLIMYK